MQPTDASEAIWHDSRSYVVMPTTRHTHTFIFLHGVGSNGREFGSMLLRRGVTSSRRTLAQLIPGGKFIFPTAGPRRSSAYDASLRRAWFDDGDFVNPPVRPDQQLSGLSQSGARIRDLIAQEAALVSPSRIILGGASSGGTMSLTVLLTLDFPLGAFIGISSDLPFQNELDELARRASDQQQLQDFVLFGGHDDPDETETDDPMSQAFDKARAALHVRPLEGFAPVYRRPCSMTPVFMGHGHLDEVIPCDRGARAAQMLELMGFEVTWRRYLDLAHGYKVPQEIDDIVAFLSRKVF